MDAQKIRNKVFENLQACYDSEQNKLFILAENSKTEGEIRAAAGNLVEHILQNIFNTINELCPSAKIESKIGSIDFLSKNVQYKGKIYTFGNIQVDRHVSSKGIRIAFIENKTYLDACYFDRALADFRKIAQALYQQGLDSANVEYVIFSGQDAASQNTLLIYEADFWSDTKPLTENPNGIEPKRFYFLKGKRRSDKPLYKIKHALNKDEIDRFVDLVLSLLEKLK